MSCLQSITISEFVKYNESVIELDNSYSEILNNEKISDCRKNILLTNIFVKRAKITLDTFYKEEENEESTEASISKDSVDFLISWYNKFKNTIESFESSEEKEKEIGLPDYKLTSFNPIVFGQFIDAKMIIDAGNEKKIDKWNLLQYIMSIFLTNNYEDLFTNEDSEQFIKCSKLSIEIAIIVNKWWDKLNDYAKEHFTVFQESGNIGSEYSENIDDHMKRWGWVNFTKNIAKTKAFDISGIGKNSIECVRQTKVHEILIWASEEKDHSIALYNDMKAQNRD